MTKNKKLKAPFPYFGGKSTVAQLVWERLGDVDNAIEPFFGSGAVMLSRPHKPKIETVNDVDCYVANFWRSTKSDPEAVVDACDWPVNEIDLHARHRWLVLSEDAKAFREKMRREPDHYDCKVAGWWCWGLCCWIGSGWCSTPESEAKPYLHGIHAKGDGISEKIPKGGRGAEFGHGVNGRPQLADAYDIGRGVNSNGYAGTCAQRRAWLLEWFGRLRDRLRTVRVCCGDFMRVMESESVTTRLGLTGIFADPPYPHTRPDGSSSRDSQLYSQDLNPDEIRDRLLVYCLERGQNPQMRIAVAGYDSDGYAALEKHGWEVVAWRSQGGYGNRSEKGKENAGRERLWFSPHCERQPDLFTE